MEKLINEVMVEMGKQKLTNAVENILVGKLSSKPGINEETANLLSSKALQDQEQDQEEHNEQEHDNNAAGSEEVVSSSSIPSNVLICKPANEWLAEGNTLPPIVPLFDPLWYEGETCFLFGLAGIGKTLLAIQIAIQIANEQPVLYCDFELSTRQFHKRYKGFKFPDNIHRLTLKPGAINDENKIIDAIEEFAVKKGIKVIIIDNLTWLLMDGQEAKKAAPFMKRIAKMKESLGLSLLIVAHTPKRDQELPIQLTDMAGSMVLQNFIDSSFAIGLSHRDNSIRYIKQTKNRSDEIIYHEGNVLLLRLGKLDDGRIGFTAIGNDRELNQLTRDKTQERNQNIKKLHAENLSHRDIAAKVLTSHTTVGRVLRGE